MDGQFELNERQELLCRYFVRRPVGAEAVPGPQQVRGRARGLPRLHHHKRS